MIPIHLGQSGRKKIREWVVEEMGPYGKKYYYFNSFEPTLCNVSREFSKYKEDRWEWDNHDITCDIIFECMIYKIKLSNI